MARVERTPANLASLSQQDPALSGDVSQLAFIVDNYVRPSVQVRKLRNGKLQP